MNMHSATHQPIQ